MTNLLIDGRAVHGRLHGISRYTLAMVEHLPRVAPQLNVTVLCHPDSAKQFRQLGAKTVTTQKAFAAPTAPLILSRLERVLKPDVFFCPSFVAPVAPKTPLVMTIHDATHLLYSRDYSPMVGLFYKAVSLPAARIACWVVTVSEYSKKSIQEATGLEEIEVVHNGVDHSVFKADGPRDPRFQHPVVFYAGGYKPHKRTELLLSVIAKLPNVQLAVAGIPPASFLDRAVALDVTSRLRILGDLEDKALAAAYRSATLFVYPSINEGFGLPPLEAMACGTPVVCSDSSSLPEVVGDAAQLFRGDADELFAAVYHVLNDREHQRRLVQKGLQRSNQFQWEFAAKKVAELLLRAAEQGPQDLV